MYTLNKYLDGIADQGKGDHGGLHYDTEQPTFILYSCLDDKVHNRLEDICEAKEIDLRFDDQSITDDHNRVHESQPGYYGDTMTWTYFGDCGILAKDEVQECLTDYTEHLTNNPNAADKWSTDFTSEGFTLQGERYESGWYEGQTDDPGAILKDLGSKGFDVIFAINSIGQFDVAFDVWVRKA